MKLLIVTDLEGVSGVVDWDKHEKRTPEEDAYLQYLMTNEVNGGVEGALKGGAKEVWVVECHKIDIRQIHPEAMLYKTAEHRVTPSLIGIKKGKWDAMAFIGNHPMAGTKNGVLSHTQNGGVKSMHLNNLLVGEFGIQAAIAGDFGMPMIMVSGDREACKQAKKLIPDIETAIVKYGTSRFSAWCLSPQKARELIAEKMEKAVKNYKRIKPFVIKGPVVLKEEIKDGMVREVKAPTVAQAFEIRCERNI
jgi:D-amino peptidase